MGAIEFDLKLLVPLRALLEEANVTRAGQRIDLGQPATSAALSRLRVHFKDELLVRVGRDYELTPMARELLPQVQRTLGEIDRTLCESPAFDPSTCNRSFTLMCTDFAVLEVHDLLAGRLAGLTGVTLEFAPLPAQPTDCDRDLMTHDFVIVVPGVGVAGSGTELFVDRYVCLVDRDNPALVDGRLSWEAFTELPHAVSDFGRAHRTPAARRLAELGIHKEAAVTATGFLPLPSVVSGTDLVAVVPERLADRFGPATGTVGVPAPFGDVEIVETLWWHPSRDEDPAHAWFRSLLSRAGTGSTSGPLRRHDAHTKTACPRASCVPAAG